MSEAIETVLSMEQNGDIYSALALCRALLRTDPTNGEARVLFARLRLNHQIKNGVNMQMTQLFLSKNGAENKRLKRWLVDGL